MRNLKNQIFNNYTFPKKKGLKIPGVSSCIISIQCPMAYTQEYDIVKKKIYDPPYHCVVLYPHVVIRCGHRPIL